MCDWKPIPGMPGYYSKPAIKPVVTDPVVLKALTKLEGIFMEIDKQADLAKLKRLAMPRLEVKDIDMSLWDVLKDMEPTDVSANFHVEDKTYILNGVEYHVFFDLKGGDAPDCIVRYEYHDPI